MRATGPRLALLFASAMAVQLCAGPCLAQTEPYDPWEGMNRRFFGFQEMLDRHIFGPLARGFGATPFPVRAALSNFTRNLGEPLVFVNDMLQGRVGQAATTFGRVAINTTVGVGGLMDVAAHNGLKHHDNGFGTTLGRWGAQPGPYLFLPLMGPSTFRDSFGAAADVGLNPLTYAQYPGKTAVGAVTVAIGGLETRVEAQPDLDTLRATSTDLYASIRSYFLQNRQAEITGQTVSLEELPEIESEPETPELAPAAPGSASPTGGPPVAEPQPAAPVPPLSGAAGALPSPQGAPEDETAPTPPPAEPAPAPAPPAP
jgi:phospholipid-binding lipoprotein MlaA